MPIHSKITKAVFEDDIAELKRILKTNDVDLASIVNSFGSPLIHVAAAAGHQDMVLELITQGVNINAVNAVGATALDVAYTRAYEYVARALLENGGVANVAHAPAQGIVFNNIAGNHGNGNHYWEDSDSTDVTHEYTVTTGETPKFCGGEAF
jgi:ankyrin repeat protein